MYLSLFISVRKLKFEEVQHFKSFKT
jgi:hypothetical protein